MNLHKKENVGCSFVNTVRANAAYRGPLEQNATFSLNTDGLKVVSIVFRLDKFKRAEFAFFHSLVSSDGLPTTKS